MKLGWTKGKSLQMVKCSDEYQIYESVEKSQSKNFYLHVGS